MNAKQISISSSKPITLGGGSVNFTCSATFGSEDSNTSGVQYTWSGPARSAYSNEPNILSLQNISFTETGQYVCKAALHGSSIIAVFNVSLQSKFIITQ